MESQPKSFFTHVKQGDEQQPMGEPADQEDRANLQRWIYLMYQQQPPASMSTDQRRKHLAWMRYECERLGVHCPSWLKDWHPDVEYHPGGTYTYHDPEDSPTPPVPYPEADDLSEEAEADLARWERKAVKATRSGKKAVVPFSSAVIPDGVASYVQYELSKCASVEDVREVFSFFDE